MKVLLLGLLGAILATTSVCKVSYKAPQKQPGCDNSDDCGRGAECQAQSHKSKCICPAGTKGNPLVSCTPSVCQYNEDCADHEACDRLNRVCRPVCDDESCAETATCIGKNHQPKCKCPVGTNC